jgi:hypothetical protein
VFYFPFEGLASKIFSIDSCKYFSYLKKRQFICFEELHSNIAITHNYEDFAIKCQCLELQFLSLQLVQKDTTDEILSKTRRLLVENKF